MSSPRVMFASYHCYHDPSNGATASTRDLLEALSRRGWRCGALTGPFLDNPKAVPVGISLQSLPGLRTNRGSVEKVGFAIHTVDDPGGFPVTVFAPDPPAASKPPTREEIAGFLTVLKEAIRRFQPSVVLTYGGDPASRGIRQVAHQAGAKVAFRLHNFAYRHPAFFADCDAIAVPSRFSRDHHRSTLGLECAVVPPVIGVSRILVDRHEEARFLTFVNPDWNKGVLWFARLAQILGRKRPDIPVLLVESRGRAELLSRCRVELDDVASLHRMMNTPDPRQFYRVTRVTLMPSLWRESFGRVAVESMLNGIPVIASDRGAIPEAVGAGGQCLSIPDRITPESRTPPTEDEVAPWVNAILALWDNSAAYSCASSTARSTAQKWHPDVIVPQWESFLGSLGASAKVVSH